MGIAATLSQLPGFHDQPREHVKITVDHSVRHSIDGTAADMPGLEFRRIRSGLLVGKLFVLCCDNIKRALCVAVTPKLNVGVFEIAQIVKISKGTQLACAPYVCF